MRLRNGRITGNLKAKQFKLQKSRTATEVNPSLLGSKVIKTIARCKQEAKIHRLYKVSGKSAVQPVFTSRRFRSVFKNIDLNY